MQLNCYQKTILCLVLMMLPLMSQASEAKQREARQVATKWLALIDRKQYQASWEQAATLFKQQVKATAWSQQLAAVREPLGTVTSRIMIDATYTTSLPGAPDGEYVVLQFKTVFTNKKESVETITPMLDGNRWRVAGYYIR